MRTDRPHVNRHAVAVQQQAERAQQLRRGVLQAAAGAFEPPRRQRRQLLPLCLLWLVPRRRRERRLGRVHHRRRRPLRVLPLALALRRRRRLGGVRARAGGRVGCERRAWRRRVRQHCGEAEVRELDGASEEAAGRAALEHYVLQEGWSDEREASMRMRGRGESEARLQFHVAVREALAVHEAVGLDRVSAPHG